MDLFERLDRDFRAAEDRRLGSIQGHYSDPYPYDPYEDLYYEEEQEEEEDGDGEEDE